MAAALANNPSIGWGKKKVSVKKLLSELDAVWQQTAEADRSQHDSEAARVRMTLTSLLMVADLEHSPDIAQTVSTLIGDLCIEYPSRIIVIGFDGSRSGAVAVEVSSQCVKAQSGSHVCSEEVYLSLGQAGIAAVPNIVRSILVPDVPIEMLLLTTGSTSEGFDQLIAKLLPLVDRLSFDSTRLHKGRVGENILSKSVAQGYQSKLRDLAWRRTSRWRRLIVEQFELSECENPFEAMCAVTLFGSPASGDLGFFMPSTDLLLLGAWISSKLQWDIYGLSQQDAAWVIKAKNRSAKQHCELRLCQAVDATGRRDSTSERVASIVFEALHKENASLEIHLEHLAREDTAQVTMEVVEKDQPPYCDWTARKVPFGSMCLSQLALAELTSGLQCHELGLVEARVNEILSFHNVGK